MPERPKRPLNGFIIFYQSYLKKIQQKNPRIKVSDASKQAGRMWHAMEDKKIWQEKAAKAKKDYERALKDFKANGSGKKRVRFQLPEKDV